MSQPGEFGHGARKLEELGVQYAVSGSLANAVVAQFGEELAGSQYHSAKLSHRREYDAASSNN